METTQTKPTGLNLITSTLNRGSVGDQVKALQQYLNGLGYDVGKLDSIYGPKVEAAVKQFQLDNGLKADGIFGPKSVGKAQALGSTSTAAGAPGTGKAPDDPSNMFNTETGAINPNFKPTTQAELDTYYNSAALAHPTFAGNSPDALAYAASSGDFSGLADSSGRPFSNTDQNKALEKANEALAPGFKADAINAEAGTEASLAQNKLDYNNQLATDKTNFENDKATLDSNAANNGVLFSGGRYEKEKKLGEAYTRRGDYNKESLGNTISGIARDYQYKYGNSAANNPSLSQYYQLGGNTYNANTARNGVGSGSLSSIYNPSNYNFQGTTVNANKANANIRAASLLANKGNKLLSTGYQNQF